jgi:hypothetical protein
VDSTADLPDPGLGLAELRGQIWNRSACATGLPDLGVARLVRTLAPGRRHIDKSPLTWDVPAQVTEKSWREVAGSVQAFQRPPSVLLGLAEAP